MSYIRGKYARAACDLFDWMRDNGIDQGVVALPSKRDPRLVVYGIRQDDIKRLPETFAGFPVFGNTFDPTIGENH